MSEKLVWYVCYGSNLALERFLCYFNGKSSERCHINKGYRFKDGTFKPLKIRIFHIPHNIFFANDDVSSNWGETGVAFLDWKNRGRAIGRAYLITEEAFEHLRDHEGRGKKWYDKVVTFDKKMKGDNYPVVTLTCEDPEKRTRKEPMKEYLDVMRIGIRELGIGPANTEKYLEFKLKQNKL